MQEAHVSIEVYCSYPLNVVFDLEEIAGLVQNWSAVQVDAVDIWHNCHIILCNVRHDLMVEVSVDDVFVLVWVVVVAEPIQVQVVVFEFLKHHYKSLFFACI